MNCVKDIDRFKNTKYKRFKENFEYVEFPLVDDPKLADQPLSDYLDQACEILDQEGTVVFVHCMQGVSRSGAIVVGYLMHQTNYEMEFDEALAKAREKRPLITPNASFEEELKRWQRKKRREWKKNQSE